MSFSIDEVSTISVSTNYQSPLSGTGFVKISGTTITYDNSAYYLASNPSAFISLLSLSAGTGINYNNSTGVITSTITQYTDSQARSAISSITTGLTYTNTSGVFSLTPGYFIPTTASYNNTNWNTAFTQTLQWNGGSTNLIPETGRTSLGATTVGSNLFTLGNPSAIRFIRINADNSISTLDASTFRTAIGAGTSSLSLTNNFISKATSTTTLGDSLIQDNGTTLGIGAISTTSRLTISDTVLAGPGLAGSLLDLRQTWNTIGTPTAIKLNITNQTSSNASQLLDLQVGGTSVFSVNRFGDVGGITRIGLINSNRISVITNTLSPLYAFSTGSFFGHTTGISRGFLNTDSFTTSGGTGVYNAFEYGGTINQTGGATGISRGLYLNPTLTSAADFRAIEVTRGSIVFPYQAVSTTYAIKTSDYLVDFTSGTFIATLPTAVGCQGKTYVLKNSGTGVITIATTSSQTIDGATSVLLSTQYSTTVVSNGANWITNVNSNAAFIEYPETNYTGTITWTATTNPSGTTNLKYRASQSGKSVTVRISGVYSVSGTMVSSISVQLPTALPTPETISGFTGGGDLVCIVQGTIIQNTASPNIGAGALYKAGSTYNIIFNTVSGSIGNANGFMFNFTYLTA